MFPIAMAVGTGATGTITFSNIPATYKHLQVRITGFQSSANDIFVKVNTDAGVRGHYLQGNGVAVAPTAQVGTGDGQYLGTFGWGPTNPSVWILDFVDYASTTKTKTFKGLGGFDANGTGRINIMSALYTTTSAINSITFTSGTSYSVGTQIALYGIKG
jgi:hypothetical protein